ncbi:MAG TPA: TIGR01777 family oxidoreductase [Candidatus Sumerlaeota bacterium]|nr:TIGR01777 family oxidoreductase [Candidatus Sumerlaeota bacterium]HNM45804.1 TIGR01777 family oxidoreductase [Candidatus Sumerlaeota bacterium]
MTVGNMDSNSPRNILITGATGLIGSALRSALTNRGDRVVPIVRKMRKDLQDAIVWDGKSELSTEHLRKMEGIDAVVNLAGESIFGRFTEGKKKRIRESRIGLTEKLCEGLAALETRPRVLVSASATGIYAPYAGSDQDELAPLGNEFLSEVCRDWEAAASAAGELGIRVVHLRITPVLSTKGGMLKVMLLPFRMNLGGRIGSGAQYVSWIALEDMISLILFCIDHDDVVGPVNAASPNAVTNNEFTETLAAALHRMKGPPLPEFAARLAFGREAAEELMLASVKAVPRHALDAGFQFRHRELDAALRHILANGV